MKPIKVWVAQDAKRRTYGQYSCYLYKEEPNFDSLTKEYANHRDMLYINYQLFERLH